jgi:hypothetical protein
LSRDPAHHYFWRDEWGSTLSIPSVTKVVGLLEKQGLAPSAAKIVAGYTTTHLEDVARLVEAVGIVEATKKLAHMPRAEWDAKADLGSRVHTLCELELRGREIRPTDEEAPYIEALRRFIADAHPMPLALEEMVAYEDEAGIAYAGTLDAVLAINGTRWLVDFKTGKDLWDETALQLAGYAFASFVGRAGELTRYALPGIDAHAVLHLRPEGYAFMPYRVGREEWMAFMALLDANAWVRAPKPKRERLVL